MDHQPEADQRLELDRRQALRRIAMAVAASMLPGGLAHLAGCGRVADPTVDRSRSSEESRGHNYASGYCSSTYTSSVCQTPYVSQSCSETYCSSYTSLLQGTPYTSLRQTTYHSNYFSGYGSGHSYYSCGGGYFSHNYFSQRCGFYYQSLWIPYSSTYLSNYSSLYNSCIYR
jgi:hypothetical protein